MRFVTKVVVNGPRAIFFGTPSAQRTSEYAHKLWRVEQMEAFKIRRDVSVMMNESNKMYHMYLLQ
jgi:hypothetical protein